MFVMVEILPLGLDVSKFTAAIDFGEGTFEIERR
jgi:hypothetical protein